ncbi:hypothetical protein EDB83DRAFT_2531343 [Lactarius deliciosus]|nr:hypothetical protein EDB83DRAFT_2531343 [Lactarius deliciosus]
MRAYIALARQFQRRRTARPLAHARVWACTLLGALRLARALAWLRFAATVLHTDVDEALRLMAASKESLHDKDRDDADARDADRSDTSKVYIKDMTQAAIAAGIGSARADSGVGRITNAMCKTRREGGRPSGRTLDGGHSRA